MNDVHRPDQAQPVRRYPGAPSLRGGVGRRLTPGGQAQRAVFPRHQGRSKKGGDAPWGHIGPRSAIDKMSLPATIK